MILTKTIHFIYLKCFWVSFTKQTQAIVSRTGRSESAVRMPFAERTSFPSQQYRRIGSVFVSGQPSSLCNGARCSHSLLRGTMNLMSSSMVVELDVQFIELDISSAIGSRTRIGIGARGTWLELGCPDTKTDPPDRWFHRTKDPIAHIFSVLWFGKVILRDGKTKSFPSICYDR